MGSAVKDVPILGGFESDHEFNMQTAKRLEQDAMYQAEQRRKAADRLAAEQINAFAANGLELHGTAANVIISDQVNAEIEAMNMIYSGKHQRAEMEHRSKQQRSQAYLGLGIQAASMAYGGLGGFKGISSMFSLADKAGGTTKYSQDYLNMK